ncbi:hypothetical protein Bca4012_090974 [Brassica carinata]
MASMLEFWRSLFKQSNPSTLTAADLIPNFTQPQHPPLTRDGDGINGESEGETRCSLMFCVEEIRGKMEISAGPLSFNIESDNGDIPSLVSTTYSWTKVANIIYLDQPAGTGFSYSRNPLADIPSDIRSAKLVNEFVHNWLAKHPEYYSNPFYVTGNSYSGIVVPAIVQEISNDFDNNDNWRIPFAHGMALISDENYQSNCWANDESVRRALHVEKGGGHTMVYKPEECSVMFERWINGQPL